LHRNTLTARGGTSTDVCHLIWCTREGRLKTSHIPCSRPTNQCTAEPAQSLDSTYRISRLHCSALWQVQASRTTGKYLIRRCVKIRKVLSNARTSVISNKQQTLHTINRCSCCTVVQPMLQCLLGPLYCSYSGFGQTPKKLWQITGCPVTQPCQSIECNL